MPHKLSTPFIKGSLWVPSGHFAAFSFHETKNISSGEGGMLVVNDDRFNKRAEIIWEKGTNRAAFWRGEVDKYTWMDLGSSFLPSDIIAAFLYAQLEHLDEIQERRKSICNNFFLGLNGLESIGIQLPHTPEFATCNGHLFYLLCRDADEQEQLLSYLKKNGVLAVFHYLSLHKSPFYFTSYNGRELPNADKYSSHLIRLPFFYELENSQVQKICAEVRNFYNK